MNENANAPKNVPETTTSEEPAGLRAGVAAWGLALYAGCRAIDIFLESQAMAAAVGQAVLVEWGSARLGVYWSDPKTPVTTSALARRVAVGAAIGFVAAAVLFVILLASHGVGIESVTHVEASVLAIGFATAALHAWRDELLLHGIVLRTLEGTSVSAVARVMACGITSAGAALGRSDATARSTFVALLLGIIFGALWSPPSGSGTAGADPTRGAWKPWAAHTAFRWATGTVLSGGLVHSRIADHAWAGGSAGMLVGTAAAVALAPLAVLALGLTARGISPRSAKGG